MNARRGARRGGSALPAPASPLAELTRPLAVPEGVARAPVDKFAEAAPAEAEREAAPDAAEAGRVAAETFGHAFGRVALFAGAAASAPQPPPNPPRANPGKADGTPTLLQRDGEADPAPTPSPSFQLTPPSLLAPEDPSARYRLGGDRSLGLRLDPALLPAVQQHVRYQVDPSSLRGSLILVDVNALPVPAPGAPPPAGAPGAATASPGATMPASPTPALAPASGGGGPAAPAGGTSGPASPGGAAGEPTPQEASPGDLLRAALATPAVDQALTRLRDQAAVRVRRDWGRLETGERIGFVTVTALVAGGALAGVASDPAARQKALDLLNGRTLPVPGVDWLRMEVNTQRDGLMFGLHLDVGAILPPWLGFGASSPDALGGPPLQRKMAVSQPDDPEEQEAERVADAVMRGTVPAAAEPGAGSGSPVRLRRDVSGESSRGDGSGGDVSDVVAAGLSGGGAPLDKDARAEMEGHFGQDFGDVRVHTDAAAADSAAGVQARAYAVGTDIAFAAGEYAPGTSQGKRLLAHELTHVVQQGGAGAARSTVRRAPGGGGGPKGKTEPADAAALVHAQFPKLALPADQIAALQKVLDARAKIEDINKEIEPIATSILSSDVAKREKLEADRRKVGENLPVALVVSTDIVLGKDVLPTKEHSPKEATFREMLYTQLLASPTRLKIGDGLKPDPLFKYFWGPNDWAMGHDGGVMNWSNLMAVQKWNLDYQKVLLGEMSDLTGDMVEQSRKLGDSVLAEGKKLGEIWGFVWNTTVKVGTEVGRLAGYYDDPQGWTELYSETRGGKGARIYLKGPRGFIHVFALDPNVNSYDLTSPDNNGTAILLSKGTAVSGVHTIRTADGFELAPGSSDRMGGGWTCKEQLTTIEQFAIGAILGDAFEDPSVMMSFGQIVIGVVPIVGQIADARDVAVGIHKIWTTGGKDGKLQTALALIGLIPLLGDGIKAARQGAKGGAKEAVKEAVKETVAKQAPAATETLGRKLLTNADEVAGAFPNLSREAVQGLKELPEKAAKAAAEGGKAATEFATEMSKRLDDLGGNAGSLVSFGGGKWSSLAKTLISDPSGVGKDVAAKMQAWRKQQFAALEGKVANAVADVGEDVAKGATPPKMQVTGTDSAISDVDISFLGPNATAHRNAAIRVMEAQHGKGWRELLDADIFGDPRRLHLFEDLPGDVAKGVEKRLVKESELNVLAKMLKSGTSPAEVEALAKQMGVKMEDVLLRRDELLKLAGNEEMYKAAELKMDSLHQQFLKETDPARRAALAEEMSQLQGKLNAAVEGPYVTPGGVAKHVTRREGVGGLKEAAGAFKKLSPAMGYMAFLDDLYMLQHVLDGVGKKGFGPSSAKSMAKYADRLAISAGQYGVDMAKAGNARVLFDTVDALLQGARKNPETLVKKAGEHLEAARNLCQQQVKEMLPAVKKSADDYLLHPPEGMTVTAADRAAAAEAVKKSEDSLNKQFGQLASLVANSVKAWWDAEEKGAAPEATVNPSLARKAVSGAPGGQGAGHAAGAMMRRGSAETRFGHDFSRIRIHADARPGDE